MSVFATLLMNGIANGALYFLLAAGLTLIFGLMRVVNFAHGGLFLWGAYISTFLFTSTHNFLLSILMGVVVSAVLGLVIEKLLLSNVSHNGNAQILMTMGVMLVLQELVKLPFGQDEVSSDVPAFLNQSWVVGHVVLIQYQIFTIVLGLLVFAALLLLLFKTRVGMVIRAGVVNPELVLARGIAIKTMFSLVFAIGAGLAGFAGALSGPYFGAVTPDMGMNLQLDAFIIVVVGGIGSLTGSFVGSFVIGIVTAFVSYQFPSYAVLVDVGVMAVVLLIRPNGLFGKQEVTS